MLIRVPPPFRHSKFRLVWAGQFANVAGDGVFPVAVALFHKVFRHPRGDRAGRAEAAAYGRQHGVPEGQLDWTE
jgi:hypothetical protein